MRQMGEMDDLKDLKHGTSPRHLHRWMAGICVVALVVAASFVANPITGRSVAGAAGPTISSYTDPSISGPAGITAGPDGALWFTNAGNNSIGRITTAGTVTSYADPSISAPQDITAGPDGALWFTNAGNNSIGRITTAGTVTNYTDPSISGPDGITTGPDGALWFTNAGNNSIGRITTAGTVTNYSDPSIGEPVSITAGPDGALWFTNRYVSDTSNQGSIGRITTAGIVTNYTDASISFPEGITIGPDGALWFTNSCCGSPAGQSIGRITTAGTVTSYTGSGIEDPTGITAGPDGALWFTNEIGGDGFGAGFGSIGRITTSGTVTNYTDPSIIIPMAITAGPDGALWFGNYNGGSIGRITVGSTPASEYLSLSATPSTQTSGGQVSLLASLRNSSNAPVPNTLIRFQVMSGPDKGVTAIIATSASGLAETQLEGQGTGTDVVEAWVDNDTGVPEEPLSTATVTWQPKAAILFIQGISSSSTCPSSNDFFGRTQWLRSNLTSSLGNGYTFLYYGYYSSPHTSAPICKGTDFPQYNHQDTCWSLDDVYTNGLGYVLPVPGGGQATHLAAYLTAYLRAHPTEDISIVAHSEGGVLAVYTVKQKLSAAYVARIRSIVTFASPLRGIESLSAEGVKIFAGCRRSNQSFDSAYDMQPDSPVIRRINDATRPSTRLYTVYADPGEFEIPNVGGVTAIDNTHSTTWWATGHIQIGAQTHSDIWDGCFIDGGETDCPITPGFGLAPEGMKLVRFTACAIAEFAADCSTYANE